MVLEIFWLSISSKASSFTYRIASFDNNIYNRLSQKVSCAYVLMLALTEILVTGKFRNLAKQRACAKQRARATSTHVQCSFFFLCVVDVHSIHTGYEQQIIIVYQYVILLELNLIFLGSSDLYLCRIIGVGILISKTNSGFVKAAENLPDRQLSVKAC